MGKTMFRIAGALIAAQVFLTFCLIGQNPVSNVVEALKMALLPIPALSLAIFFATDDDSLTEAGHTVMFWAVAGLIAFLLALYGDVTNKLRYVDIPEASQVSFGVGFGNFSVAFAIGFAMYLWGQMHQPPPPRYHDITD
jgi:predicted Na+-dependent transporter